MELIIRKALRRSIIVALKLLCLLRYRMYLPELTDPFEPVEIDDLYGFGLHPD